MVWVMDFRVGQPDEGSAQQALSPAFLLPCDMKDSVQRKGRGAEKVTQPMSCNLHVCYEYWSTKYCYSDELYPERIRPSARWINPSPEEDKPSRRHPPSSRGGWTKEGHSGFFFCPVHVQG